MSDARLLQAQEAMTAGRLQEAMAILKGVLQERPEEMEIRNLLMECQAGMMLQLQLSEKLKKAKSLMEQGLRPNAEKLLQEILKVDPGNREAAGLLAPPEPSQALGTDPGFGPVPLDMPMALELPTLDAGGPAQDASATEAFRVPELPPLDEMPSLEPPMAEGPLPELSPFEMMDLPEVQGGMEATVLSSGTAGLGSAEQARIRQYIEEGKALEAQGHLQDAIDTWTRVFILDEENGEVQQYIDAAKARLQGDQGEIEHALAEGIAAFNSGQMERARPLLEKVLQALPGHKEAQYYLDRMGKAPAPPMDFGALPSAGEEAQGFELEDDMTGPPLPAPPPPPPPPPPAPAAPAPQPFQFGAKSAPYGGGAPAKTSAPGEFEFDTSADAGLPLGQPAPAVSAAAPAALPEAPPPPVFEGPAALPMARKAASSKGARKVPGIGVILGGIAGVLLLAVAIFVVTKFMGGEKEGQGAAPAKLPAPSAAARPKPANTPAANSATPPLLPTDSVQAAVTQAREAMEAKDFARATQLFQQALLKEKDNGEAQAGLEQARALMVKQQEEEARNQKFIKDYTFAVGAYRDQEYKESLTVAWRLIYPDEKLADELGKKAAIRRLLRDGYYNWAVKDLKTGNARDAEKNLGEALNIDANDSGSKNLQQFARRYAATSPDALYWETVKTLAPRPFTEGP